MKGSRDASCDGDTCIKLGDTHELLPQAGNKPERAQPRVTQTKKQESGAIRKGPEPNQRVITHLIDLNCHGGVMAGFKQQRVLWKGSLESESCARYSTVPASVLWR